MKYHVCLIYIYRPKIDPLKRLLFLKKLSSRTPQGLASGNADEEVGDNDYADAATRNKS
jgi:hypothetical protein